MDLNGRSTSTPPWRGLRLYPMKANNGEIRQMVGARAKQQRANRSSDELMIARVVAEFGGQVTVAQGNHQWRCADVTPVRADYASDALHLLRCSERFAPSRSWELRMSSNDELKRGREGKERVRGVLSLLSSLIVGVSLPRYTSRGGGGLGV